MKLIVISSPNKSKSEIRHIIDFFDIGMDVFHVKKKGFSKSKMIDYIESIPMEYRNRIVLHSHFGLAKRFNLKGVHISSHTKKKRSLFASIKHFYIRMVNRKQIVSKSYYSIQSMMEDKGKYEYVFLSPIFDRHDVYDFSAAFSEKQLRRTLFKANKNVVALGGVNANRIELARRTGFTGVALHSTVWKEKADRMGLIQEIRNELDRVAREVS